MNIYFTASIVGKKHYLSSYEAIITELKKHSQTVISDHILLSSEEEINMETKEERRTFHSKLEHWITDADCVVVEASFPSISVGYEISLALSKGKAVLVLHTDTDPPSLLPELNAERLVIERYEVESLPTIITDFLLYAKGSHESRFTFYLTHKQSVKLTFLAQQSGIPKSAYLRNLIDNA